MKVGRVKIRFAIGKNDLIGTWQAGGGAFTQYYFVSSGNYAGMNITVSNLKYFFANGTSYRTEVKADEAAKTYFQVMNVALDEMPEWANVTNKDKQAFNDMLIGFSGMVLAVYTEGKQNNDDATLATSKKLAGMLIEMILKTDPENLRIENGQIVMK